MRFTLSAVFVQWLDAGQAHDKFFSYARSKQATHLLGTAAEIDATGVRLEDGRHLPADVVVFCGGTIWQGDPTFLAGLGLGVPGLKYRVY